MVVTNYHTVLILLNLYNIVYVLEEHESKKLELRVEDRSGRTT